MSNHTLEIRVYDGTKLLFERRVPAGQIGRRRLEELLRALAAKGLDYDEVVDAHLNRNARGYKPLLEVRQDGGVERLQLTCGVGVQAVVRSVED